MKENNKNEIAVYPIDNLFQNDIPIAEEPIHAGFPSPAQGYMSSSIDISKELINHPGTTFFGRVAGMSMIDAGIEPGDILIIDKSLEPVDGNIVICFINGEFTMKFIYILDNGIELKPANPDFPIIKVSANDSFKVWGVVTYTIKCRIKS